ncbi:MAG TPA: glycerophosphodiester phosphodiesterase [Candidatus Sulfotelmatobacter sp.]|jgi:glycerophosphoryl diester phosphodiesterase|nr:glycerophosphodiester phosphodiesterase [Candidatus Sulfotelmatobacter sp.]
MPKTRVHFPKVIGHRGAAAHAPENTLASFAKAKDCGAPWVELDVQLSADGVPVVFHDDDLDRTSNGHGLLTRHDAAALAALDAGSWFGPDFAGEKLPTLEDALCHIAALGLGVNIEIKADEADGPRTAVVALALAQAVWPQDAPVPLVSSFAESAVATAKEVAPAWPRAWLVETIPSDWKKRLAQLECTSFNVDHTLLSPALTREIKDAGYGLLAYTVNHPARAERLWAWGVDGVFSDRPDLIAATIS